MGFDIRESDEYLGDKAELVVNNVIEFTFEKLPAITIVLAILYLIWNLLDPVIVF
jgi:hypothetical protein